MTFVTEGSMRKERSIEREYEERCDRRQRYERGEKRKDAARVDWIPGEHPQSVRSAPNHGERRRRTRMSSGVLHVRGAECRLPEAPP